MARNPSVVAIDLSHLPKSVQDAVGPELSLQVARNMKLAAKPVIIGKLRPGLWGFINPDAGMLKQIAKLSQHG